MRHDQARTSLDRHATYIVAAYTSPEPPGKTRQREQGLVMGQSVTTVRLSVCGPDDADRPGCRAGYSAPGLARAAALMTA